MSTPHRPHAGRAFDRRGPAGRVRIAGLPAALAAAALAAAALAAAALAAAALAAAALVAAALVACGRDEAKPSAPAAAAPPTAAALKDAAGHEHSWDDAAGLGLVVRAGANAAEMLVAPDSTDARGGAARAAAGAAGGGVVLFGRAGMLGRARADSAFVGGGATATGPVPGACATWSAVRLGPASGADAAPAWSVGFVVPAGAPQPSALALDSLDELSARDSAQLAAAVTRLAAAIPDTAAPGGARRPALRGVPFRVRDAHRFTLADGSGAVVAVLTRTVNVEAAPFAEQTLLVAERQPGRPWRTTYAESVAGSEESLPAMDVLAAIQLPASAGTSPTTPAHHPRSALVLGREGDEGSRYTLLEREAPGRWRARWTSAVCGTRTGSGVRSRAS